MGIYTNTTFSGYSSSDYTSVEPFKGDHFNYHELGIIAAAESAANQNAFMKAIALQELASMEQYGNTEVLYESVDIKGIFEKIKAFFKKIIEKIHKIFHTFIAKMSSWFGNSKNFAKKYEKEVIKNWSKVSKDWEFKGYKFNKNLVNLKVSESSSIKADANTIKETLRDFFTNGEMQKIIDAFTDSGNNDLDTTEENIKLVRDHMEDIKDCNRADVIDDIKQAFIDTGVALVWTGNKLDSKEFTEELFKAFRSDEDSKTDLSKNDIETMYGSISGMTNFIKDFDKVKSDIEKTESTIVKSIDKLISDMNKAENDTIKRMNGQDDDTKKMLEQVISISSLYQSIQGFRKELLTQAFGAWIQAIKDSCSQAKEIAVKVIGLSKKMTESADYSSDSNTTSTAFGGNFISAVKLV